MSQRHWQKHWSQNSEHIRPGRLSVGMTRRKSRTHRSTWHNTFLLHCVQPYSSWSFALEMRLQWQQLLWRSVRQSHWCNVTDQEYKKQMGIFNESNFLMKRFKHHNVQSFEKVQKATCRSWDFSWIFMPFWINNSSMSKKQQVGNNSKSWKETNKGQIGWIKVEELLWIGANFCHVWVLAKIQKVIAIVVQHLNAVCEVDICSKVSIL